MPLDKIISERSSELPEGYIGKLLKILVEEKNIISLGPGEPDYVTPKHIIQFAKKKLDQGFTHYSPAEGRKELLEEISKKLKKENKIYANPENIIVTNGSNEALLLTLLSTIDPGEQMLIPDPDFLTYIPMTEMLNGYPISFKIGYDNGKFSFDIDEFKRSIKEPKRIRGIIIDNPANPTGIKYSKKQLEEIADIAIENDFLIISDEAYEKFVYKGKHISIGSLNGMESYVVTLHSFSKTFGMAGFRIGYAVGPEELISTMRKLHVYTTLCAPTVSQLAAIKALRGPKGHIEKHVKEYKKRMKFLVKRLKEIGFECEEPDGAFYVFTNIKPVTKMKSVEFSEWLIKNAKVATVPGIEFGRYGEGFIRMTFATPRPLIEEAMNRIEKTLKKSKHK